MGKHIPSTHKGYNMRWPGSRSGQFTAVASDVKTTAMTIPSLLESV